MRRKPPLYETNSQHETAARRKNILKRVSKLAVGVCLAPVLLLGIDEALGAHTPTETTLVNEYPSYFTAGDKHDLAPEDSIIAYELPGFNAASGYIDSLLGPILDKYGTRVLVRYGDDLSVDVVTDAIAHQLETAESETQPIVLYGHSMGGDISIRVASELIEKYHIDPNRFAIILDCSPASNDDVNTDAHQAFISFMDFVSHTPLRGGPISRFGAEAINAMTDGNDFFTSIELGWERKSPPLQENGNAVVIAQAHIINDQQPLVHAANILKKYNVPIAFIAPATSQDDDTLYRNDGIVHNSTANADWKKRFGENLTDYLITKKNLHGIQKRNSSLYVGKVDDFLRAQGINPYQPDKMEEGGSDVLLNANGQNSFKLKTTSEQPFLDTGDSGDSVGADSGNSPIGATDR